MSEKSCQPEGLQPERPLTLSRGLLIFAISAGPRFALSTVLAATHTCFIMLGTLSRRLFSAFAQSARARCPALLTREQLRECVLCAMLESQSEIHKNLCRFRLQVPRQC